MFEEVPRTRRGLVAYLGVSQLTTRRIVLGPFVIGGGVVLAAIGGSVAVAATVFTASTIRASDVPPHPHQPIVVAAPPDHQPADCPEQRRSLRSGADQAGPTVVGLRNGRRAGQDARCLAEPVGKHRRRRCHHDFGRSARDPEFDHPAQLQRAHQSAEPGG